MELIYPWKKRKFFILRKNKIALLGVGGNFLDIFEAISDIGKFQLLGYINPIEDIFLKQTLDLNYLGTEKDFNTKDIDGLIITFAGLGKDIINRKIAFEKYSRKTISLIFKTSSISKYAKISASGVIIFVNTVIKSFTNIHENVFINSGCIIGHHVLINKNSVISLGVIIGGKTTIEEEVFIGMGARIFQGLTIGKGSIIGAGAIVRKSLPPNSRFI